MQLLSDTGPVDWQLSTNPPYPVLVNDFQLFGMAAATTLGNATNTQLTPHGSRGFCLLCTSGPGVLQHHDESAESIYALHSPNLNIMILRCFRLKLPCLQLWRETICIAVSIPRSVGAMISSYFSCVNDSFGGYYQQCPRFAYLLQ